MQNKIKSLAEIESVLEDLRLRNLKIVQCHGVFDLLHPGHIRHFKRAKAQGDTLVVTVTPDRFVNKGPGRPAFHERLRLETLSSLSCVDYVVLNDSPDAINAINAVRPHIYVKGKEYSNSAKDLTGKITLEVDTVRRHGGDVYYTDDIVFSSSSLINQHFSSHSPEALDYIEKMKAQYSLEEVLGKIDALSQKEVIVIGDAIIDEYQYVEPLGQSGKGIHMTAACLEKEVFLGGSLIIANHLAQYAKKVILITAIGFNDAYRTLINEKLHAKVEPYFIEMDVPSLVKKRYVLKDGASYLKLFETYSVSCKELLSQEQTAQAISLFQEKCQGKKQLAVVCDFGNGFSNAALRNAISQSDAFLAVNTQTNSGNRGYNVITHYRRADFISLNEPEIRLAAHDRNSSLEGVTTDIAEIMNASYVSVTRGVKGVFCLQPKSESFSVPALSTQVVDRLGAGDSYLSLTSLALACGYPFDFAGFIGSSAAALDVQIVGNRDSVEKPALCKFLTRLFK